MESSLADAIPWSTQFEYSELYSNRGDSIEGHEDGSPCSESEGQAAAKSFLEPWTWKWTWKSWKPSRSLYITLCKSVSRRKGGIVVRISALIWISLLLYRALTETSSSSLHNDCFNVAYLYTTLAWLTFGVNSLYENMYVCFVCIGFCIK